MKYATMYNYWHGLFYDDDCKPRNGLSYYTHRVMDLIELPWLSITDIETTKQREIKHRLPIRCNLRLSVSRYRAVRIMQDSAKSNPLLNGGNYDI